MTAESNLVAEVTQSFSVPAERVFDAWLDPNLIGQWMFGPALRDEEILSLSIDPRVGGQFSFRVRRGSMDINHIGEYLELDRPHRLVFTWGIEGSDSSRVTVEVMPQGTGCELKLSHELHPAWAEYVGRTREGWTKMIGVLKRVLHESAGTR